MSPEIGLMPRPVFPTPCPAPSRRCKLEFPVRFHFCLHLPLHGGSEGSFPLTLAPVTLSGSISSSLQCALRQFCGYGVTHRAAGHFQSHI